MREIDVETLVVGAGVAGLAAALALERAGHEVLVVDAFAHPGGVMATDEIRGYRVERGPNTFALKPPLRAFLRDHGLANLLVPASPESRKRFILRDGALVPVPMNPFAFAGTPLLSFRGKLRLLAEPFIGAGDPTGESVAGFISRRLGSETATALVGPFLTGVYAGDEERLGVEAVFPSLVDLERAHGGIVRGLAAGGVSALRGRLTGRARADGDLTGAADRADATRSADAQAAPVAPDATAQGVSGTCSAPEGLGELARGLASQLRQPPRLGARVALLLRDGSHWRVQLKSGRGDSEIRCARVVLAIPAAAAGAILKPVDAEAAAILEAIEYAPIVAIGLGVDPDRVRQPLDGFGFLVPRQERLGLLGCLFMSRLFPGRAPAGRELLHCMVGGVRWPDVVSQPDDVLYARLEAELDRSLGFDAAPERLVLHRWPRAVPQPSLDHPRRIATLRRRIRALAVDGGTPTLELAGSYLDGVSVCDALLSGVAAARTISATASTQAG